MAGDEWVLDTQILEIASAGEGPLCLHAVHLLCAILEDHFLALDQEEEIRKEYSPHMRRHTAQWWALMNQRGKLRWHSQRLTRAHRRKLNDLRFDPSDWKFLGVASQTVSKLLVAEESDYWAANVAQCIQGEMGICLLRIAEALQRA